MFAMTMRATGEVRDADGNLLSSQPIEQTVILTEEQVQALTQGETP
jgi:hypothetical protein